MKQITKMLYNFIPTVNRKVFSGEVQSFKTHLKSAGTHSFPVQQAAVPRHNSTAAEAHRSLGAGVRKPVCPAFGIHTPPK